MKKQIKSVGGEEANRECPVCHSRRIWKDGLRETKKYGSVQRFICRDCGYRFSESSVEVNVAGKVAESLDSGKNHHKVRVASRDASDEKVNDSLSFFSGENVSSKQKPALKGKYRPLKAFGRAVLLLSSTFFRFRR